MVAVCSQVRRQLLLGGLSDGVPAGLPEHAHREPGGAAEQHGALLRAPQTLRDHDALLRQRVPDRLLAAARHGRRALRLLIVPHRPGRPTLGLRSSRDGNIQGSPPPPPSFASDRRRAIRRQNRSAAAATAATRGLERE